MIPVRQSTAFEISVGPVLDADGVAVTTCDADDFKIKKTTGDFAALNGSATATSTGGGHYDMVLTTSDLDTVGLATIKLDMGTNACQQVRLQVVEEAVYDMLYAASAVGYIANQPVNVVQMDGESEPASVTLAGIVQFVIEDNNLDHVAKVVAGSGDIVTNSALGKLAASNGVWGDMDPSTDSQQSIRDRGDAAWLTIAASAIRAAIGLASANLDTQLDAIPTANENRNAVTGGAYPLDTDSNGRVRIVDGTGAGELNTSGGNVTADVASWGGTAVGSAFVRANVLQWNGAGVATPAVAGVPHVNVTHWDDGEITENGGDNFRGLFANSGAGSSLTLSAIATAAAIAALNDLSASEIRDAVGLTSANLDTQLGDLPTALEIRNAVTGGAWALSTNSSGMIRIADGTATGELSTTGGAIDQVLSLGTQAKADVNAEVVDAMNVDTYAEPGQGTPAATASLAAKLNWLYASWRNKSEQDADEWRLFGDDGTTVLAKRATSDDGTTYTPAEMTTGA